MVDLKVKGYERSVKTGCALLTNPTNGTLRMRAVRVRQVGAVPERDVHYLMIFCYEVCSSYFRYDLVIDDSADGSGKISAQSVADIYENVALHLGFHIRDVVMTNGFFAGKSCSSIKSALCKKDSKVSMYADRVHFVPAKKSSARIESFDLPAGLDEERLLVREANKKINLHNLRHALPTLKKVWGALRELTCSKELIKNSITTYLAPKGNEQEAWERLELRGRTAKLLCVAGS